MSAVILPLRSDLPFYRVYVELESVLYGFEFHWNHLAEGWFMSIFTADDQPILSGVRLVVDWPLNARGADARLPPGILIAQDTTGARQDPGEDDLGTRTVLLYFTSDELAP